MYQFKTKPYKHQLDTFLATKDKEYWGFFLEMGGGKSKLTIDSFAYLYEEDKINGCVLIVPKSLISTWVMEQLPKHLPDRISNQTDVLVWSTKKTMKYDREKDLFLNENKNNLKIIIVNTESFISKPTENFILSFLKKMQSIVCIDESTYIKNPAAKRSKVIVNLCQYATYRRILTGSPSPQGATDLFMQCNALHKQALGIKTFTAFKTRYCITQEINVGTHRFQKITGYKNLEELNQKLSKFTTRITKDECLDLPLKIYTTRDVEMTKEQKKIYNEIALYSRSELYKDSNVTAKNIVTKLMRLQQITCGFSKGDKDEHFTAIEGGNPRLAELKQILLATKDKVIIWANYRHNLTEIEKMVKENFGENSYITYHGGTESQERNTATYRFQNDDDIRFFISNPRVGGFGLTLTKSSTTVYYSNDYNLETRLQSEDRNHRISQDKNVLYIDLICKGTVDEKIIKALRSKKDVSDIINGDAWKQWL